MRMQLFVMRARARVGAVDGDGDSVLLSSCRRGETDEDVPTCAAARGRGSGGRDLALLALLEERGIGEMSWIWLGGRGKEEKGSGRDMSEEGLIAGVADA